MPRYANSTAHSLARDTTLDVIEKVWVEEIPNCIYGIVTL